MAEFLRDELARVALGSRVKFLGFGKGSGTVTGTAAGVVQSQKVQYNGIGVFLVLGVCVTMYRANNWQQRAPTPATFRCRVLDMNRAEYMPLSDQIVSISINRMADNLDDGILLESNDFLIVESTVYDTQANTVCGFLWGEEYYF